MTDTHHAVLSKLPALTFAFWIMKIAATTLGETAGDLLSMTLNVGYLVSTIILMSGFLIVLVGQLSAKRYHPFLYWAVILATSTAGTTMSDFMNRTLGLGYATGSLLLASGLAGILLAWRLVEGSLSVSTIRTTRAETFYWAAILLSNTLGTALGDFLADDSGLGFLGGAGVIGCLLLAVLLAYRFTAVSHVALFWVAFVLTRPFGATFGDLLTKPVEKGGMNLGTVGASAVLATILAASIAWTSRMRVAAADSRA